VLERLKKMSGVHNQISDQTIQAIALLGGATAQSYGAVSLNVSQATLDSLPLDPGTPPSYLAHKNTRSDVEVTSQSSEKFVADTSAPSLIARPSILNVMEELSELPDTLLASDTQNPELMSRFEGAFQGEETGAVAQQIGLSPGAPLSAEESSEALTTNSAGFSLLDFIEQAIAQAEASQQEFDDTFDGSRQGEFRELIVDTGTGLGSGVREFLQENVAGSGRDLLSSSIDATGVEFLDSTADPLLNIDYYAKSAEVLNGLLDSVAQPIGSIVLPQLGPLLADPREELSAYLG
jgi:hypothetical protein